MNYRTATAREIAECIKRQVVDTCDLAETAEYRNKPRKLRSLIRDIRICAESNRQWLAAQPAKSDDLCIVHTHSNAS